MEFCIQLSTYYPDKDYGGDHAFADMLEQARLVILDRFKHAILIEAPEQVLAELKPFLLQQN